MLDDENKDFFKKLDKSHYRNEEFQHFQSLFNAIFQELEFMLNEMRFSNSKDNQVKYQKNMNILNEWYNFSQKNMQLKESTFGFPVNLVKRTFLVDFFRIMEAFDISLNNCGDIYDLYTDSLTSKSIEWDIVGLIAEHLGLPEQPKFSILTQNPKEYANGYWGYVTSGGSESNAWGIRQGFLEYPTGMLYFCESAHYSIPKASERFNHQVIMQNSFNDESIDVKFLLKCIRENWKRAKIPAIVILTFGTTKYGSVDDITKIKKELKNMRIPHYLHIDAAFYGGIPRNQEKAPQIPPYDEWGYDSICVSVHKYIGYPVVKSVLISTRNPSGKFIDYIGQEDNTVAGSRDIPAFSLRQQIIEILHYSEPKEYIRNIDFFIEIINELSIEFIQWSNGVSEGNIFVFEVNTNHPDYKNICERWELCDFINKNHVQSVHVVILPYHSHIALKSLAIDLSKIVKKLV